MDNNNKEKFHENYIEGRNAVLEAFRSGKTIDKLFVLDGCQDGPIKSITRLCGSSMPSSMMIKGGSPFLSAFSSMSETSAYSYAAETAMTP